MFNSTYPETELAANWLGGRVANEALWTPVDAARVELRLDHEALARNPSAKLKPLSETETRARRIWKWLENTFDLWKLEHGTPPKRPATDAERLNSPARDVASLSELDYPKRWRWRWDGVDPKDIPAYEWAGVKSYADLLHRLLDEKYPGLDELPARELWAVVVLKEASEGHIDAALCAYSYMESAVGRELSNVIKRMAPLARTGAKIKNSARKGHEAVYGTTQKKQKKWSDLQAAVDGLRKAHPDWSKSVVALHAAKECRCSPTTIKRHTVDPGRKK